MRAPTPRRESVKLILTDLARRSTLGAMQLVPLGSGSQGNSVLVRGERGAFLIDAGFEWRELVARLKAVDVRPGDLDGIVLTHRHLDHVRGAGAMSRRFRLPVYASERTAIHQRALRGHVMIHPGTSFELAGCRLYPVRLSHDAPETLAFRIESESGALRIGYATDLGSTGGGIEQALRGVDLLYLEFNYDRGMLRDGPYEWSLKRRVASPHGHLSNDQAAHLLARVASPRLRALAIAHVSLINNTSELALAAARRALASAGAAGADVRVAGQHEPTRAFSCDGSA